MLGYSNRHVKCQNVMHDPTVVGTSVQLHAAAQVENGKHYKSSVIDLCSKFYLPLAVCPVATLKCGVTYHEDVWLIHLIGLG